MSAMSGWLAGYRRRPVWSHLARVSKQ